KRSAKDAHSAEMRMSLMRPASPLNKVIYNSIVKKPKKCKIIGKNNKNCIIFVKYKLLFRENVVIYNRYELEKEGVFVR
ncbi:MAG: hypothetical protein Q4G58_12525, partial [bacterium]|nr:hypothetical protein [bacterium]